MRRSDSTTRVGLPQLAPNISAPMPERTEPIASTANASCGRSSAAWIAVALVLSRYAGSVVENTSVSAFAPGNAASVLRAASTPIEVVSSSYDATARVPFPPPAPIAVAMAFLSRRKYGT